MPLFKKEEEWLEPACTLCRLVPDKKELNWCLCIVLHHFYRTFFFKKTVSFLTLNYAYCRILFTPQLLLGKNFLT